MSITLAEAEKAIQTGKAEAERLGVGVSISVLDSRGDLKAAIRMDGVGWYTATWAPHMRGGPTHGDFRGRDSREGFFGRKGPPHGCAEQSRNSCSFRKAQGLPLGFRRPADFHGFPWISMDFHGFHGFH